MSSAGCLGPWDVQEAMLSQPKAQVSSPRARGRKSGWSFRVDGRRARPGRGVGSWHVREPGERRAGFQGGWGGSWITAGCGEMATFHIIVGEVGE